MKKKTVKRTVEKGSNKFPIGLLKKKITSNILKVDRSNLLADFDLWPSLALRSWEETKVPILDSGRFERVILAGMGGSLLTGELVVDLAKEGKSKVQFETLKDYHIPDYCNERTLLIGMSSSGNTEETLSAISEAQKAGLKTVAFGSGGTLESLSNGKWNIDFVRTTMLKVPRSSLPGIYYPVLKFLVDNGLLHVHNEEIDESIRTLKLVKESVTGPDSNSRNIPLSIAGKLFDKGTAFFPLIYSSCRTRSVGLRFRQSLNENSKMHAFNGEIPELCHNEIVGWDGRSSAIEKAPLRRSRAKTVALFLRLEQDDPIEIRERFNIVEDIVKKAQGEAILAPSLGNSYLARIMSMLYYLDYVTYYLAILRGIDPIMMPSIDLLKRELSTRLNYVSKL